MPADARYHEWAETRVVGSAGGSWTADQAIRQIRARQRQCDPFVMLRYPEPVLAGREVTDSAGRLIVQVPETSWLVFVDLDPLAFWNHRAELWLIGVTSGVTRRYAMWDLPLFDDGEHVFGKHNEDRAWVESQPGRRITTMAAPPIHCDVVYDAQPPQRGASLLKFALEDDVVYCPEDPYSELPDCGRADAGDGSNSYYCDDGTPGNRYALLLFGPPQSLGNTDSKWVSRHDRADIKAAINRLQQSLRDFHDFDEIITAPLENPKGKKSPLDRLEEGVAKLENLVLCNDDVFVFYIGHGQCEATVPPGTPLKPRPKSAGACAVRKAAASDVEKPSPPKGTKDASKAKGTGKGGAAKELVFEYAIAGSISPEQLRSQLSRLKTCHLNVVMDCCFSGGFVPTLKLLPGLESMYTACRGNQTSKVSVWDQRRGVKDKPGKEEGGEFSSGFIGYLGRLRPHDKRLKDLCARAYARALLHDAAANAGATTPQAYARKTACNCVNLRRYIAYCPESWTWDRNDAVVDAGAGWHAYGGVASTISRLTPANVTSAEERGNGRSKSATSNWEDLPTSVQRLSELYGSTSEASITNLPTAGVNVFMNRGTSKAVARVARSVGRTRARDGAFGDPARAVTTGPPVSNPTPRTFTGVIGRRTIIRR